MPCQGFLRFAQHIGQAVLKTRDDKSISVSRALAGWSLLTRRKGL